MASESEIKAIQNILRMIDGEYPVPAPPDPVEVLSYEILGMLKSLAFSTDYQRLAEDPGDCPVTADGLEWAAHLAFQDIVLRLCKLNDDNTKSWSFEQVEKELRKKAATRDRSPNFKARHKRYVELIQHYVHQYRTQGMAHVNKTRSGQAKALVPVNEPIEVALQIIDELAGKRVEMIDSLTDRDYRREFEEAVVESQRRTKPGAEGKPAVKKNDKK